MKKCMCVLMLLVGGITVRAGGGTNPVFDEAVSRPMTLANRVFPPHVEANNRGATILNRAIPQASQMIARAVSLINRADPVLVESNSRAVTIEVVEQMTANGDCDADGDVDLVDFGSFQLCFTGGGPATPECADCSDFDGDGDVDLVDFGSFQLAFTGSIM